MTDEFTQIGILGCWSAAQLRPCAECLEPLASPEQVAAALGLDGRHPDAIQDPPRALWLEPDFEAWEDRRMLVGLTRRSVEIGGLLAFS